MPEGAKPAPASSWKPMRSASRSMSREKLSWPWIMPAWLPAMAALAALALLERLAAMMPISSAARPMIDWRLLLAMPRAMWRCVMWLSSCASTEASSSREAVMAIRPRWTPT